MILKFIRRRKNPLAPGRYFCDISGVEIEVREDGIVLYTLLLHSPMKLPDPKARKPKNQSSP